MLAVEYVQAVLGNGKEYFGLEVNHLNKTYEITVYLKCSFGGGLHRHPRSHGSNLFEATWISQVSIRDSCLKGLCHVTAPAGFWPRGQNPRRQPRSPRIKKWKYVNW